MDEKSFAVWFWKYIFYHLPTLFCGVACVILACRSGKVEISTFFKRNNQLEDDISELSNKTDKTDDKP